MTRLTCQMHKSLIKVESSQIKLRSTLSVAFEVEFQPPNSRPSHLKRTSDETRMLLNLPEVYFSFKSLHEPYYEVPAPSTKTRLKTEPDFVRLLTYGTADDKARGPNSKSSSFQ